MLDMLTQKWWVPLVRGIFAILFGVLAIIFPATALTALVLLFGAYAIVDGGFALYHAVENSKSIDNQGWTIVEGIVSILAGLAAWFLTPLVGLTLLLVIGVYAIFTGVMQMAAAWRLREEISNEIFLGLAGIMSVIFGALVIVFPISGAFAIALLVGAYSIAFGALLIGMALRLRSMNEDTEQGSGQRREPLTGNA